MKITLANLAEATEQQVFDQVAKHLLEQNARSMTDDGLTCAYRGAYGRMCAAGCLIDDGEYNPRMEENDWCTLTTDERVTPAHSELIFDLQQVHDSRMFEPSEWREKLRDFAHNRNLNWTF